jgi:O-antigen ligase
MLESDQMATARLVAPVNPFQKVGFFFLLLYLIILVSRILDLTIPQARLPLILYVIMLGSAFMLGGILRGFTSKVTWLFLAHLLWMAAGIPFSTWRSGSAQLVMNSVKIFLFFLAINALIDNIDQLRKAIYAVAFGLLGAALLSFVFGMEKSGRLQLQAGTLADPNEFAMYMLLAFCLWLWVFNTSEAVKKILCAGALAILFVAFLKTGSRGGLVALLAIMAIQFFAGSVAVKLKMILAVTIGVLITPLFISDYLRTRFTTVSTFDSEDVDDVSDYGRLGGDTASTETRKALLTQSLLITMQHPLFGIGAGMFPVYTDQLAKEAGLRRGHWQPTHNSFTQISSECGIPSLIFFTGALVICLRSTIRIRKLPQLAQHPHGRELQLTAHYLRLAIVSVLASAFFLSVAYGTLIYVLAALICVLERVTAAELAQPVEQPATAAASPVLSAPILPAPVASMSARKP